MKAVLFRDMKAEGWRSMDRYADELGRSLRTLGTEISAFSLEPPLESARLRIFWRNEIYPRLARRHQGDVNHVLDQSYGHLLNFLDPERTIVTCHDLIPLEFEADENLRSSFRKTIENLRRAVFVIADSKTTANDLVKEISISPEKIEIVHLGVDRKFVPMNSFSRGCLLQKFRLPDQKLVFSHGNSLAYKNLEGLLAAFGEALAEDGRLFLVKAGSPFTKSQRQIIKNLGLDEHFREIIFPSDEELAALYGLAEVFISPSLKEGFGLTVLQALACGTPVIVSRGTSLEEIAGEVGIYVDPRNITEIARSILSVTKGETSNPKEVLIKRAALFSWEKTARETLEVYRRVFRGQK